MRIVTLLPSATEIVCALGLDEHLVGVSHSCSNPPEVRDLPAMTRTHVPYTKSSEVIDSYVRDHLTRHEALYDLDIQRLSDARPDVIISQALCDVCAVSTGDVLKAIHSLPTAPTLIDLKPNTLVDVLDDIARVGKLLEAGDAAAAIVADFGARRNIVAARTASIPLSERPRVAFLEWLSPPFNGGHWNPELVALAGGINLLGVPGEPSSTRDWETVAGVEPDALFIACCGFGIERTLEDVQKISQTDAWQQLPAVRNGRVYVADGAYYSCPGPRLIDGLEIMAHALHPTIHNEPSVSPCHIA